MTITPALTSSFVLLAAAVALSGCSLVLDLPALQGGDTGAADASVDGSVDASRDAGVHDAAGDANLPDANLPDTDLPDAFVVMDAGDDAAIDTTFDAGNDAGSDAGFDAGNDGGSDAGHDGGNDAAVLTVGVGGIVVGLPSGTSIMLQNGPTTQTVTGAGGNTPFTFDVTPGASYDVSITSAPSTLLCVMNRGQGTASATVTNLFVGCSTAVDLVSYFPFDGDMHAVRGADWTSTSGAGGYTTDRIGRTGRALAGALAGLDYRLMRALDGSSGVPLGGTQFTASIWMLLPSSVGTTTTDNMFNHIGSGTQSASMQVTWLAGTPLVPHLQFYFYWDGGSTMYPLSPIALDRDHWHHMVIAASGPAGSVTNGFVRALWVDGVNQASAATCCGWGNTTDHWELGPSNMLRDDLRLYGRMLTDAEIQGIYAAENIP